MGPFQVPCGTGIAKIEKFSISKIAAAVEVETGMSKEKARFVEIDDQLSNCRPHSFNEQLTQRPVNHFNKLHFFNIGDWMAIQRWCF